MMTYINSTWVLLLLLVAGACSSTKKITKPEESYIAVDYKPTISNISIPINIQEEKLSNKLNEKLNGLLYEDNELNDDNLELKVWKRDPISLSLHATTIEYRVPLKLHVKYGRSGFGFTLAQEMDMEIALKYKTSYNILPDWSINTITTSNGYEWLKDPVLDIGGVKIPVKTILSKVLDNSKDKITSAIDKQIKQNLDLKKYLEPTWAEIQKPMLVNRDYNLWLCVSPKEIYMTPLINKQGNITCNIGIQSATEVFVSTLSPNFTPNPTLPPFKIVNSFGSALKINLGIDYPYAEAEKQAIANLQGKVFEQGSRKVTIKDIKLYGNNGKIVVATTLEGSFNGTIYLKGVPRYNVQAQSVQVEELEYDLETKNVLLKSASWLFKGTILKKINESMVFSIAEYLKNGKDLANKNLSGVNLMKGINAVGKLDKVDIDRILLAPNSFKVIGTAEGKLAINIAELAF